MASSWYLFFSSFPLPSSTVIRLACRVVCSRSCDACDGNVPNSSCTTLPCCLLDSIFSILFFHDSHRHNRFHLELGRFPSYFYFFSLFGEHCHRSSPLTTNKSKTLCSFATMGVSV
ncbi:hypothetical protein BGZ63DRAFT_242234 [Mariannaea sp. PMI_226]|nr:hypothetical protein BGZ63DRAFT_242234 [Mariannaea sp. PMI_226]